MSITIADGMNWIGSTFSCTKDEKPNCWSYFRLREWFGSALSPKERGYNYIMFFAFPIFMSIRGTISLLLICFCWKKMCGKKEVVEEKEEKTEKTE